MKKRIISLGLAALFAISLSGCSIRFGINNRNKSGNGKTVEINEKVKFHNEEKIDIDVKYGEIAVSTYEGDEVIVTGSTNRGENIIKLSKSGDGIKIKDSSDDEVNFDFFINSNSRDSMTLNIKIPNNFNGDIDFDYGAGEANINGIKCNKLDIEGGAGELNIEDIVFEELVFNGGVGESNIDLTEKCGNIKIEGGVGEVKIAMDEVGGNLIYNGGVGRADIRVPENAPIYFDTSSGIGKTDISAKTSGENTYKFELNVGVGEIKVYN